MFTFQEKAFHQKDTMLPVFTVSSAVIISVKSIICCFVCFTALQESDNPSSEPPEEKGFPLIYATVAIGKICMLKVLIALKVYI